MSVIILGISAYYHDSAAAIVINGDIIAAAQEERFSRKKHDFSFPSNAGGALGVALLGWYLWKDNQQNSTIKDSMKGAFLGPEYDEKEIFRTLRKYDAQAKHFSDFNELVKVIASSLSKGKVVGWFQGRMEYGPRALSNRSILGDARNAAMQNKINEKIKHREGFRPFAPTVLEEDIQDYFELDRPSPYMMMVVPVKEKLRKSLPVNYYDLELYQRLQHPRSDIPSVTHVDYSARIQSINKETNPKFWLLINEFKKQTGCSVIINTSFNVKGEPIVCTPDDAFRCFIKTEMDYLVMGNYVLDKKE